MAGRRIGEAFIRARLDTAGMTRDAERDMATAGHGLGNTFKGAFTTAFAEISATFVSIFAISKVIGEFKQSVGLARDLGETQSAVNVIFGEGAAAVNQFAAKAATALGQTRNQALGAANTFATFGKSAGLGGQELVDFSTRLVSLSADLASFKNTSPEEAITAIGAALRGESEPIRRYGILLDDATLRQRALALGIVETTKDSLTPQQRVLAAQAEIFAQTSDAQGDFIRTSGGLANQQRITAASIAETKTKIGELLLPAITAVTVFFNTQFLPVLETKLIPALGKVRDWFVNEVVPAIREHLVPALQELQQWFEERILPNLVNHVLPALQRFGEILVNDVLPPLLTIARVAIDAFSWLTSTSKGAEVLRFTLIGLAAAIVAITVVQKTVAIVAGIWTAAQWLLNVALTANPIGIIIVAIGALVGAIIWVATKTTWFQTIWEYVWGFLKAVGAWFAGPFAGFFVNAWNNIVDRFVTAKNWIVDGFNNIVGFITGLPGRITAAAAGLWDGLVYSFKSAVNWLIRLWNNFSITLGGGSVLGLAIPSVTLSTPDIPYLQRGGLVDRTGLAVVHRGELVGQMDQMVAAIVEALANRDSWAGLHVENLNVRAYSDRFSLTQMRDDLALHGAH